jgi:PAS domain S-box-containing protein
LLFHALRFCGAQIGHLGMVDSEATGLRFVAQRGCATLAPAANASAVYPVSPGALARALDTGLPQNIPDLSQDSEHTDWSGRESRSLLSVPILREERAIGVLTLESLTPGSFWLEHEQFLSQLAAQSAIALSNAMLYKQLQAHLREQTLLFQAGARLASTLSSASVLNALAESAADSLSCAAARIYRLSPEGQHLVLRSSFAGESILETSEHETLTPSQAPGIFALVENGTSAQWTLHDAPSGADRDHLVRHCQAGSVLALPLRAGEETLGLVEILDHGLRHFSESEVRIGQTIASQAAVALKNTDLFRQIQESHDRLTAVLNSTNEAMLMVNVEGRILIANQRLKELTGVPVEGLEGKPLQSWASEIAPHLGFDRQALETRMETLRHGELLIEPAEHYRVDHPRARTLSRSETPVRDSEGRLIGWLVVLRDITEEERLAQARQHLTEMIVHDLRSPLTAILSSLSIVERSAPPVDEVPVIPQALTVAQRSCEQMLGLVNSLLDIAKLEAGEMVLERETFALGPLLEGLIETCLQAANEQGVILEHILEEGLAPLWADRSKLHRVLSNLLDNALRYTPAGGRIQIHAKIHEGSLRIGVADTGPGIPPAHRETVFERFYQVGTPEARGRGTGLGLAFARLAVEAHGGEIWVEENPGGGSLFLILLPFEEEPSGA